MSDGDISGCYRLVIQAAEQKKKVRLSSGKNNFALVGCRDRYSCFLVGFTFLLSLTDPYSAYGRMITNVFKPLYVAGNNGLAWVFTKFGNYTFYYINVTILSLFAFIVGLVTFGVVGILSWRYGRMYCNTFCPVGTLLGFLSRYSLFKVHIDTSKCNGCGLCALKCKGSCIDSKEHSVDYSRCVACFDCLENCRQQAVSFTVGKKKAAGRNL